MKFIILSFIFYTSFVLAQIQSQRKVFLEWDAIARAVSYEIEITNISLNQKNIYKLQSNQWIGELPVGNYEFKIRALDKRGVSGSWSPAEKLQVRLAAVKILEPKSNQEFINAPEYLEIHFQWESLRAAKEYLINIYNEKEEIVFSKKTSDTSLQHKFESNFRYKWSIEAISESGTSSEKSISYFNILSALNAKSKLHYPESPYVRSLTWTKAKEADAVSLNISYYNSSKLQFETKYVNPKFQEASFDFPAEWLGGKYKVSIASLKNNKIISESDEIEFQVAEGERSQVAETKYFVDKYLSKESGSFYHFNYILSNLNYSSESEFYNAESSFSGFMNSFNASYGEQITSQYGYRSHLTLNTLSIQSDLLLFADLLADVFYRKRLTSLSETRVWLGLRYFQAPIVLRNMNDTSLSLDTKSGTSYQLGADLWYSLKNQWGTKFQFIYENKFYTLDDLQSQSLIKFGGFLTHNFSSNSQAHMGLSYVKQNFVYTESDFALDINMDAVFLNVQMEWGF